MVKVQRLVVRRRAIARNGESMQNIDLTEFKALLDERYTQEQLAAKYNCSVYTIKKYKKDNGLIGYKTNKKPLRDKDIQFLEACASEGKTLAESCKLLGLSVETVVKYLPKSLHTRLTTNSRESISNMHRRGSLEGFLVPTTECAYFIGLLQSDGNISREGTVKLAAKDKDMVLPFAKFINSSVVDLGNGMWGAQVKHVKLTDKFKQVTNILPNKTYTAYEIPTWVYSNEEYMWNFIIGVFNGDGSIAAKNSGVQLQIEQHSSQAEFLKKLNTILGWNVYLYDYAKVQTSKRSICEQFYNIYSNNEFSLLRKVLKLESLLY